MKKGIIVVGHGSRKNQGKMAFLNMVKCFAGRYPDMEVTEGFLEFQEPSLEEAFNRLYRNGIHEIFVLPAFLFTGIHLRIDIPYVFKTLAQKYSGTTVRMASYMGLGDQLVNLCEQVIRQCEKDHTKTGRSQTALLVVGVGASVSKANEDIRRLTDIVRKNSGFGYASCAFISKMATPYVTEGLEQVLQTAYKRIIVCPLLLFPGVYLENITLAVETARKNTSAEILLTASLGSSDGILDMLDKRLDETINGKVDLISELPDDLGPRRDFLYF